MGRRAHKPDPQTRRQVEAMAGYGIPENDIGRVIGIDAKTLRKHYRDELDTGHIKANAKVAESLFRHATSNGPQSVTAAIFWMKTRGRWSETFVYEHGVLLARIPTEEEWVAEHGAQIIDHEASDAAAPSAAPIKEIPDRLGNRPGPGDQAYFFAAAEVLLFAPEVFRLAALFVGFAAVPLAATIPASLSTSAVSFARLFWIEARCCCGVGFRFLGFRLAPGISANACSRTLVSSGMSKPPRAYGHSASNYGTDDAHPRWILGVPSFRGPVDPRLA